MPVTALRTLLERRWHGAAVHGRAAPLTGWPTGIASLDQALAPAGVPHGRLTEIFGDFSSGKTTLAYALLAACTSLGDIGAYIDPEHCFFAPAAESAGIDLQRLIVVRPRETAAMRRAVDAVVRSGACAVVILDGAGGNALQTHHCARLVGQAEKTGTTLVALSRGDSQVLASFASLRVRMRGLIPLWQPGCDGGSRLLGYRIALDVAKSKMGVPGKTAAFEACMLDVVGSWPVTDQQHDAEEFEDDASRAAALG